MPPLLMRHTCSTKNVVGIQTDPGRWPVTPGAMLTSIIRQPHIMIRSFAYCKSCPASWDRTLPGKFTTGKFASGQLVLQKSSDLGSDLNVYYRGSCWGVQLNNNSDKPEPDQTNELGEDVPRRPKPTS